MDWIRHYILAVTAASVICTIVKMLVGQNGTHASLIKLMTGLILSFTLIAPWSKIDFADISQNFEEFTNEADAAVASGTAFVQKETATIIKAQTEAYILDKAQSLGMELSADVTVDGTAPALSYSVVIHGDAAPYTKMRLTQYIRDELGIPEERQIWM